MWKTIPGQENYEVKEDRRSGVIVRSKERAVTGMGMSSYGKVKPKLINTTGGRCRLRHPINSLPMTYYADDLWSAAYQGKPLKTVVEIAQQFA